MTTDWVITFTFDADPSMETMDRWETQLEGFDATVARIPARGIDVTVYAPGALSMLDALYKMDDEVLHVVQATPVGVEIVSESEHRRRAEAYTMPELMSAAEIADELGISRQRVHQLRSTAGFPEPLADLRGGAVWDADAVRNFAQTWERKPGRPPSGAAKGGGFSFRATKAVGSRPHSIIWRIEHPSKNRFVLRNIGSDVAENVEVDVSRISVITRNLPKGVAIAPGEGFDMMLMATWGAALPNQLYVRWAEQDEWLAVPLAAAN